MALGMTRRGALGAAAGLGALGWAGAGRADDNEAAIARRLEAAVAEAVRTADFSGAVMLKRGDRVVYRTAVGLADRGHGVPNTINTRFNVASIGKMFTATAILRLADQGRVDLDAPIIRYLPDYPDRDIVERITPRQLLSHSSGLGNYWEAIADKPPQRFVETKDFLPLIQGQPLQAEPGTTFGYSNSGYVVLGLVIEVVTGEAYADHIRRTLFDPLGMDRSGDWPLDLVIEGRADGYVRDETTPGAWRSNTFVNQYRGNPAGGGYSTVSDLLIFVGALRDGRLFSEATRAAATTGMFDMGRTRYGLGFIVDRANDLNIVGQTGGHVGIASEVWLHRDTGWSLAIMTNGEVDGYWGLSVAVKDMLCGESPATDAWRLGMAMVTAAADDSVAAARALFEARPEGMTPRMVFEVEAAKAKHRGRPDAALRILEAGAMIDA